jgi:hypothetical protein
LLARKHTAPRGKNYRYSLWIGWGKLKKGFFAYPRKGSTGLGRKDLQMANRARANADFHAITPVREVASFKTQRTGGVFGWGQHQFHKILRDKRWE